MRRDFKLDTWEKFNECAKNKDVYLFGAGYEGEKLLNRAKNSDCMWNIKGFLDNDKSKIGSSLDGVKVYGTEELLGKKDYVVLITIVKAGVIAEQLHSLGIKNYWSSIWMDDTNHDFRLQEDIDMVKITKLKEILFDEKSKEILDKLIQKRKTGFMDYTDIMDTGTEYFRDDFFALDNEEVFIDCGAYDGDTVNEFCKWTEDKFKSIYAYEPGEYAFQKMEENVKKSDSRMHLIDKGVYSHKVLLPFINTDNMVGGHIDEDAVGTDKQSYIECVSLDEEIKEKVTFIKMDIEGIEIPALKGAKNIILKNKPKLAICIYHKPNDLWEIPLMINEWMPEYRMHIRHFGRHYTDTILYAYVP